jgi:hypothetical protein
LDNGKKEDSWGIIVMAGFFICVLFLIQHLSKTVDKARSQYEEEWKKMKHNSAEQEKIYNWYEPPLSTTNNVIPKFRC